MRFTSFEETPILKIGSETDGWKYIQGKCTIPRKKVLKKVYANQTFSFWLLKVFV